jgi:hypothetical protein
MVGSTPQTQDDRREESEGRVEGRAARGDVLNKGDFEYFVTALMRVSWPSASGRTSRSSRRGSRKIHDGSLARELAHPALGYVRYAAE